MAQDAIFLSSRDLEKLYRAIGKVDKEIRKNIRKRILVLTKPIVQEVRAEALSIPSKGGMIETPKKGEQGLSLRQGIASAVETKILTGPATSFGVRIRVSGTKFRDKTGKYRTLPRYMEGLSRKSWRHPVYAKKGKTGGTWEGAWVEQKKHPYLLPTVLKHKQQVREEVIKAFIDALDTLKVS